MMELNGGYVSISSGDTAELSLCFEGELPEGEITALVTLKRRKEDTVPIWQKRLEVENGTTSLILESGDTALPFGTYWWDVRLLADGYVITPLPPQMMNIIEVVGRVE